MRARVLWAAVAAALISPSDDLRAEAPEVTEVRRLLDEMRADYERRIAELERRLERAERAAEQASRTAASARPEAGAPGPSTGGPAAGPAGGLGRVTSGTAFNPQISVILDGNYYSDSAGGEGTGLLGSVDGIHAADGGHGDDHGGHAHGETEQGFNLRSAELAASATVDPYFDASAYLAIGPDGDVDLEEAWFRTRGLPAGLAVKGGKFLSDVGYANNQHPHQWDFVDQSLPYLNLWGEHGLQDTGVQLTWLPDWRLYTLFGVEALQGKQDRFGALADDETAEEAAGEAGVDEDALGLGREQHGPRLYTAFVKVAPDLGYDHALQLGAWAAWANQHQEIREDPAVQALEGDAWMWGLDAVYKHDAGRAYGAGSAKVQGEYLWQRKDLALRFDEDPDLVGDERRFTEDGLYLQGWYGIAPRWQVGVRYDVVGLTNALESGGRRLADWDDSDRWTAALTWTPSELSRLRLQLSRADLSVDGERERLNTVYLQYLMSLGAHGAHGF